MKQYRHFWITDRMQFGIYRKWTLHISFSPFAISIGPFTIWR
jgi:hypothetical protein